MGDVELVQQGHELSVIDVVAQVAKMADLMDKVLKNDQHYGVIPGTKKPTLLKPGAEKINLLFRIGTGDLEVLRNDMAGGHREITIKTPMVHLPTGRVLAYGVGSCSTMESKYRYRNQKRLCPSCGNETIVKGKEDYGGGWLCWRKNGGCGAKFSDGDQNIEGQKVGKIENADIADVYNTVLKMAAKRSYVDGTIKASAASDFFTQDAEDTLGHEIEDSIPAESVEAESSPATEGRKAMEEEVGRLASIVGADALSSARKQLEMMRDMVRSGGIKPDEYMEKLKALRDTLETQAAGEI